MNSMDASPNLDLLTRRERQIMAVLYRLGEATAQSVQAGLEDPPGYSTVRKWLSIMEEKGYLHHRREGKQYVYIPVMAREEAKRSALDQLVDTFFRGSRRRLLSALVQEEEGGLSGEERATIADLLARAEREGR